MAAAGCTRGAELIALAGLPDAAGEVLDAVVEMPGAPGVVLGIGVPGAVTARGASGDAAVSREDAGAAAVAGLSGAGVTMAAGGMGGAGSLTTAGPGAGPGAVTACTTKPAPAWGWGRHSLPHQSTTPHERMAGTGVPMTSKETQRWVFATA